MYISCMKNNKLQIIVLYSSTLIGTLLGVIVSVINTNTLLPNEYGDVRYIQNVISFISSILLLGYFTSGSRLLAISNNEADSRKIRGIMCVILCLTIFILSISLLVLGFSCENKNISRLFIISVPVCGNVLMLNYINTTAQGDNHILRISFARFIPQLLYCLTAIHVFHKYDATSESILLLYNGSACLVLFIIILSTRPSYNNLRQSLLTLNKENKNYGFNVYLGALMGVSTSYIAGITLGQFCENNTNVGYYTLALTMTSPLMTLPGIIGTTFFKQFAHQNKIPNKVFKFSILITVASCVVFIIAIKWIVVLLYNDSYYPVAKYASFLAVGMCIHGLGDMINRFLGAHGQGKQIRNSAVNCGLITIIGSIVFVYFWNINGAIITKVLGSTVYFISLLRYYFIFLKTHYK